MSSLIGAYELARHLEMSPNRVYQMVQKGQLPFKLINGKKLFDLDEVKQYREANKSPLHTKNTGASAMNRIKKAELEQAELAGHAILEDDLDEEELDPDEVQRQLGKALLDSGAPPPGYAKSRAIREHYAARLQQIKYEETVGLLTKTEEVAKVAFEIARTVRDKQQGIARRLAPVLAGETDERSVEDMIAAEINASLESMFEALKRKYGNA